MSGAAGSSQWMYATGYEVDQSLRLNDNGDLNRTPGASNRRTYTLSAWIKRTGLMSASNCQMSLLDVYVDTNNFTRIVIESDDQLQLLSRVNNQNKHFLKTTQKFRDPNAWYHIVVAVDTTDGTADDRGKIYINGVESTIASRTNPDQNYDGHINAAVLHDIGKSTDTTFDGYLAEYNFIDGLALDASYFGETDATYGHWKPKKYGGAYGTNGFYLPFEQDYTVEGFNTVTYKGTGAVRYVGGTGFQPDLVWIKSRDHTYGHHLTDAVRGAGKDLYTDTTDDDYDNANSLQSFESDGFTLGTDNGPNNSSKRYVAWTWDMGGSNANNTTGSINSVVRANATYGQSIVSYTGTGSTATIGHGLSSAPEWIIIKRRDASTNWPVWHTSISDGTDDFVELNSNGDKVTNEATFFTSTDPTSSVFSVGSSTQTNANNATHIAYCWHSVTGYSSFGSYTGNGDATGPTITTGFRPAFVMIKVVDRTDGGNGGWFMYDNTRSPNTGDTSAANHVLQANSNAVEIVADANLALDFLSNGFQLKASYDEINVNNGAYIYMAFADKREYAYFLDQSGNNNDWQSNNLTESDISVDSPTNNFATWNPLMRRWNVANTLAEGNTKIGFTNSGTYGAGYASIGSLTSGKWYWETLVNAQGTDTRIGIGSTYLNSSNSPPVFREYLDNTNDGHGKNGAPDAGGFDTDYGASFTAGDIIGVALDIDNGTIAFYKNNSSQGTAFTDIKTAMPTGGWIPFSRGYNGSISTTNWGQDSSFAGIKVAQGNQDSGGIGDFFYTPPSGFLALCTKNLPEPAVVPSKNFNNVLYTGTGSSNAISVGFQPDWVWIKMRTQTYDHNIFDSVRGAGGKYLYTNATDAEATNAERLKTFDSNGFTVGTQDAINENTHTFVAYNWKANGSGSANTNGSINTTSTSANVDAGFSISTYTGNDTAGATVGHGLSQAPDFIMCKRRSNTGNWTIFWNNAETSDPQTDYWRLDTTGAVADSNTLWNDTAPTATVFSLGDSVDVNASNNTYVAYCFHNVDGFSKMGYYEGNGADDGGFVPTGFRPAWVMTKEVGGSNHWHIMDNKRSPINPVNDHLKANDNAVEDTDNAGFVLDFVSNGFKWRDADHDNQAATYIFMAFAETPFKYANAK